MPATPDAVEAAPLPLTALSEDEKFFQSTVRKFAREQIRPYVREMDEAGVFRKDIIQQFFEMGLMGIEIPEEYGGQGGSFFQAILAVEELSAVDPSAGVIVDVQNTICNNAILKWANPEQKAKYLPRLAADTVLQIAHKMWDGDQAPHQGRHYHLARTLNSPGPVQRPHPPILIAGGGEKKTLRLVAQYADACHLLGHSITVGGVSQGGELARKLDVLREHCAAVGRDYAAIEKTVSLPFGLGDDPAAGRRELLARLETLAGAGFGHVILAPSGPWGKGSLAALAGLLPGIHAIEVSSQ